MSKPINQKTKLTIAQFEELKGSAESKRYKREGKFYVLNLKMTRALVKAYAKAEKFVLLVDASLPKRHYLGKDLNLTLDRKAGLKFALGFDDPVVKVGQYGGLLNLKFKVEQLGKPIKFKSTKQRTIPKGKDVLNIEANELNYIEDIRD